jgi:hypothetical protein
MMRLHGQILVGIEFAGKPQVEIVEKAGARILTAVCHVLHKS